MFGFGLPFPLSIPVAAPARQWQAAKMRPTQFGDNKNRPSKKPVRKTDLTPKPEN